jgi:hypothetical protein
LQLGRPPDLAGIKDGDTDARCVLSHKDRLEK